MTKIDTVRYIGETSPLELTNGKIYKVLSVERGWYRVVDDTGEDYLYPAGNRQPPGFPADDQGQRKAVV